MNDQENITFLNLCGKKAFKIMPVVSNNNLTLYIVMTQSLGEESLLLFTTKGIITIYINYLFLYVMIK